MDFRVQAQRQELDLEAGKAPMRGPNLSRSSVCRRGEEAWVQQGFWSFGRGGCAGTGRPPGRLSGALLCSRLPRTPPSPSRSPECPCPVCAVCFPPPCGSAVASASNVDVTGSARFRGWGSRGPPCCSGMARGITQAPLTSCLISGVTLGYYFCVL